MPFPSKDRRTAMRFVRSAIPVGLFFLLPGLLCGAAEEAGAKEYGLGEAIPLESDLVLTVTREALREGTVETDKGQRSVYAGAELRLTFENRGARPVQEILLLAGEKHEMSNVVLIQPGGKRRTPQAIQHVGSAQGYRSIAGQWSGVMITDGCFDNGPLALVTAARKYVGLGCMFCSEPGQKDELLMMFRKGELEPGSKLLVKGCSVCPKQGMLVRTDPAN